MSGLVSFLCGRSRTGIGTSVRPTDRPTGVDSPSVGSPIASQGPLRLPIFATLPLVFIIAGCAIDSTIPPEVRTTTVEVKVPIATPCFTEDQRPVLPPPTPIDPETATTEQLAAAELADAVAMQDFARAVDALFLACQQKGTS